MFGGDGEIAYIIHRVEDVTEFVRLKQEGREQHQLAEQLKSRAGMMEAEIYRRAQQIQEANRQLRELQTDLERRVEVRTADLRQANEELQREIIERQRAEQDLVVNARDAMPDGGKLTIETANAEFDEEYARSRLEVRPGSYVMVAVSDTGIGMAPEVRARMFEPFFTTKEMGKGTGLGLSTVHGIVKQSEGHLEVYSELGHGTTVKVYLPRVEARAEALPAIGAAVGRLEGSETVLVVEDEETIRRVIGVALRLYGYTVLEAADGSEAIALCERGDRPIDLVITDVIMPLMSGPELALRVTRTVPHPKVLFVSGYTDRALIHQGLRQAGTAFLQKPFTPETLARKVREILDEPRARAA